MIEAAKISGSRVYLEPLQNSHFGSLIAIGMDPSIWKWNSRDMTEESHLEEYLSDALRDTENGLFVTFVTRLVESDEIVGMSRYGSISIEHKRLEIGWTWIGLEWQRSFVNTEAKYLMLKNAFEDLEINRVELKTDTRNLKSRNAMKRIGAVEEGILRQHMQVPKDSDTRDSVYYSILKSEWPQAKLRLEEMMARKYE